METPKTLREFKRNPGQKGIKKKTTSILLNDDHKDFIRENGLNLSAIVRSKVNELMSLSKRELKKLEKITEDDDGL